MPGDDPKKKTATQAVQRNVSAGQARFNAGPWDLPLKLKARNYSHEISSCHHPYWILMPTYATQSKIPSKMESTQLNKTVRFINAGLSYLSLNSPFNKINPPLEAVQAGDVPSLESRFRHVLSSWCRMTMKDPGSKRDKREIRPYCMSTHCIPTAVSCMRGIYSATALPALACDRGLSQLHVLFDRWVQLKWIQAEPPSNICHF